ASRAEPAPYNSRRLLCRASRGRLPASHGCPGGSPAGDFLLSLAGRKARYRRASRGSCAIVRAEPVMTIRVISATIFCAGLALLPGCSRDQTTEAAGARAPLYDNLGSLHHEITTASPEAQQYFDQGLRLSYAFNHAEAIRAFRQAVAL